MQSENEAPENRLPSGKFGPPRHVGMRRHVAGMFRDAEGNEIAMEDAKG